MKVEGLHYGKAEPKSAIAHLLLNQDSPFAHRPVEPTFCNNEVFDATADQLEGRRVCSICLKMALTQHMKLYYRLPDHITP